MKIIFDLDGTLLDVSDRHYKVYSELVEQFSGKALSKADYWNRKRENVSWPVLLEQSKISLDKLNSFMDQFIARIERPDYLELDKLFPDSKKVLDGLSGNELFLLSLRRSNKALLEELEGLGVADKFNKILSGHTEGHGSDLKINLMGNIESGPKDLVIGDTEADVLMAKKLGLISVAVTSGIRSREFLDKLQPDYLIEGISELPRIVTSIS